MLAPIQLGSIILTFLFTMFKAAEMNDEEGFKFRLTPLTAENYFTWSYDMALVLCDNGLWKFVEPRVRSESCEDCKEVSKAPIEADETKRDRALAYILTSVDNSCKSIVWQVRCRQNVWVTLRETIQKVSKAAIDAELSKSQALTVKKEQHIVEYSNRLVKLIRELEGAGQSVTVVDPNRALLLGLPKEYNLTVEATIEVKHTLNQAVAKLIVRETRM